MKKIALIVIVFSISLSSINAQEKLTEDQKAVQNTIIKMFDALSNRDSVSLKSYCTSDITLFEYGMTWTIDTLINKAITLNQAKDFKRINIINFINTTVHKDIAWATYNLRSEITRNGKHGSVQWLETVILIEEKQAWKIKLLHSTLIKRE